MGQTIEEWASRHILEEAAPTTGVRLDIREVGGPTHVAPVEGSPTRRRIQIIDKGWGSSGYYSLETLKRAADNKVFHSGLHMYLNHPSTREEREQPERRVEHLAASLRTDAQVVGDALVAEADIFEHWAPVINNLANDIGVSIRAHGEAHDGEAEGRQGVIIDDLTEAISTDFVTRAGRGGKVMELIESAIEHRGKLEEARNVGEWLEAFIHRMFTMRVDDGFGEGFITREERKALSKAIGDALDTFNATVEKVAPQLFTRDPFSSPDGEDVAVDEGWKNRHDSSGDKHKEASMGSETDDSTRLSALEESVRQMKDKHEADLEEKDGEIQTEKDRADRAEDALLLERAGDIVDAAVANDEVQKLKLPDRALERVKESVLRQKLPLDEDGKLIQETLVARTGKAVKEEYQYLKGESKAGEVTGVGGDSPLNIGESALTNNDDPVELSEADQAALESEFGELGLSEDSAKVAVKGR